MRMLFITTKNKLYQGDLLENTILHGLRSCLGDECVDYPKKKVMYHDFSEVHKDNIHGRGFSLLTTPIKDISNRNIFDQHFDVVLYGDGHIYGEGRNVIYESLAFGNVWFLDGHDLYGHAPNKIVFDDEEIIGTQFNNSFKRELTKSSHKNVYPTGFGIPKERLLKFNTAIKHQLFQKTVPDHAVFRNINDLGGGFKHHKFSIESEYYNDLSSSWFGLTCKKGGWDCLRHYEIIAAGACLLFRDYDKKPPLCSPQNLPCFSYSSKEELDSIINRLIVNNKPTDEYIDMVGKQRKWLLEFGTTESRANNIIKIIGEYLL